MTDPVCDADAARADRWPARVAIGSAVVVAALGLTVLAGWAAHSLALIQIRPQLSPMTRNAAACFLLSGAALLLVTLRRPRWLAVACLALLGAISLVTIAQLVLGVDAGIDELLGASYVTVKLSSPGRMAPVSAVSFAVCAIALAAMLARATSRRTALFLGVTGSMIWAIGVTSGMALAFGSSDAFGWGTATRVAPHASIGHTVLGAGMVALAWRAEAESAGTPRWLPISLMIAVATGVIGLWEALMAAGHAPLAPLPAVVLGGGSVLVAIIGLTVSLAQQAHAQAVQLQGMNRILEEDLLDIRRTDAVLKAGALQDAIFNSANFSSIATDARGVIQIFNVGAERMLGYRASEVMNQITPADISDPQELIARARALSTELGASITPGFEALVFKASRGIEDIYELTYVRKDGARVPAVVSVTALRDAAESIIGYLLIGTDNTARRQAELERKELDHRLRFAQVEYSHRLEAEVGSRTADLAESERLYRLTFDTAPVGIVHVGIDGNGMRVNQRLCDFLGYSRDELERIAVPKLLESPHMTVEAEAFRQMAAGTADRHVIEEKRYRRRDGSFVWARVIMSVHRDADGQSQHVISVIEDVTERRTLEAQVRQAGKMDAIGKLASGVAHDFNNLLTVIIGFGEVMAADAALSAQHRSDLDEILKAARRASGLTRQLLAFSRQQVLNTVPLDVNGLIRDMATMLGRLIGENIKVTLALDHHLSLALADRGQLEQVVMNLVVNARDAMPGGGTVTIETTDVDLENSTFHKEAVMQGRYVMLAIADTGSGMTVETQRQLFEPFFTTKETGKGTGLGLSTTYGIVKQSKGYIWVYSEPGQGTTFKVYLPRALDAAAAEAVTAPIAAPAAPPVASGNERVLLVEDEAGVRHLSKRILDGAGFRVVEAVNGEDAERVFDDYAGEIDLVVTDVVMPGCGGPELLARLHRRAPALRVLYMSGYTEQAAVTRAGIDRGRPFVQKPFTSAEFVRSVRDALDR